MRRCVWSRNIKNGCSIYIYIYIYDISRLRVKYVSFVYFSDLFWWIIFSSRLNENIRVTTNWGMLEYTSIILVYRVVSDTLFVVENRRVRSWMFLEVSPLMQTVPDKRKITYRKFQSKYIYVKVKLTINLVPCTCKWGHAADGAVCWGTALQARKSRVRFPMVSLDFFIDIILPAAL